MSLCRLVLLSVLFASVIQYHFSNFLILYCIFNSCVRSLSSSSSTAQTPGSKDNASSQSPTPAQGSAQGNGSSNGTGTATGSGSSAEDRAKLLRAVVPCQQTLSLLFDARHIGWYITSLHITSLHFTSLHITSLYIISYQFTSYHSTSLHFTILYHYNVSSWTQYLLISMLLLFFIIH